MRASGGLGTWAALARRGWTALRRPDDPAARARLETLLLDDVLRRPIVYEDTRGLRYVLNPGENAGVYLENEGNYEVAETRFCERAVRPGSTAVDVGANIGLYTLLLSKLVGPDGHVHAFEPEPRNFSRLTTNLALNDAGNVTARQAAVSSSEGTVQLNLFPERLGAWHSLGRPTLPDPFAPGQSVTPETAIDVASVSLDGYCSEVGIERIDLLKVDVEGAELEVLIGAEALLGAARVGVILFEVSLPQIQSLGHEPAEIFDFLAERGFSSFALDAEGRPGGEMSRAELRYGNYVAARDRALLGLP